MQQIEKILERTVGSTPAMLANGDTFVVSLLCATRKTVIEVGAYQGALTRLFCYTAKRVYSIDHFKGDADAGFYDGAEVQEAYRRHNADSIASGRLTVLAMDSVEAAHTLSESGVTADLIWIDAAHDYDHVRADIAAYRPLLADGGVICGHDAVPGKFDGLIRAVDELLPGAIMVPPQVWAWWPGMPGAGGQQ